MTDLVKKFNANYNAISQSENLSDTRKSLLLRNLLNDIDSVFFSLADSTDPIITLQQPAAKQLYENITANLAC